MLFLKVLYWILFLVAIVAYVYLEDVALAFFLLLLDMVLIELPKH